MKVHEIDDKKIWQDFIESVQPNTFLHTWQWGEFEKSLGHFIVRLGIFDGEVLVAAALFSKIRARRGTFLLCPHGPIIKHLTPSAKAATPLLEQGEGAGEEVKKLEEILSVLKEKSIEIGKKEKCDFIRISTLTLNSVEHHEVFKKAGFRDAPIHMHSELAWILDVTPKEEELLKNMKKNTRYSIKKAEKDGVSVRHATSMNEKDFEIFWNIYMVTATRQHFTPYSKDFVYKEFKLFFEDNQAVLFFAEYQGKAISTAFIVYANGSGYYHHGASDYTFPGITPSEILQWHAICEAKKRGMKRYNFWGIVPETAVKHPWQGLSKFKRSFGGYAEEYVHAQDYVLTSKYWLNFIVEKVRKIKRGL